jgi:hypothetical protein
MKAKIHEIALMRGRENAVEFPSCSGTMEPWTEVPETYLLERRYRQIAACTIDNAGEGFRRPVLKSVRNDDSK